MVDTSRKPSNELLAWEKLLTFAGSVLIAFCFLAPAFYIFDHAIFNPRATNEAKNYTFFAILFAFFAIGLTLEIIQLAIFREVRRAFLAFQRKVLFIIGTNLLIGCFLISPWIGTYVVAVSSLGTLGIQLLKRYSRRENGSFFRKENHTSVFLGALPISAVQLNRKTYVESLVSWVTLFCVVATIVGVYGVLILGNRDYDLSPASHFPLSILSGAIVLSILTVAPDINIRSFTAKIGAKQSKQRPIATDDTELGDDAPHLLISNLTLHNPDGKKILSDVNFECETGCIIGLLGESGSGKSTLLKAIANSIDHQAGTMHGRVIIGRKDIFSRRDTDPMLAYLPEDPIILPVSGADNLSCFGDEKATIRAKAILSRLTFSSIIAGEICDEQNASLLPFMKKRLLSYARAFSFSPPLYLIDLPEHGLPENQIKAISENLREERKKGKVIIIASNHRSFLDILDKALVLSNGSVIEYDDAGSILNRLGQGWSRFDADLDGEIETDLRNWVNSQFKRPGDEGNQRKCTHVAVNLLNLSYRSIGKFNRQHLKFDFKHYKNYCVLKLFDDGTPISDVSIERARQRENLDTSVKVDAVLADILQDVQNFECTSEAEGRCISVSIATYDPRLAN